MATPQTLLEDPGLRGSIPLKMPKYRFNLFLVMNVLRYPAFCNNVDEYNGYPVSRAGLNAAWDELIEIKWKAYNRDFLRRRWPKYEQMYMDYLRYRASLQKWNDCAEKYWALKEERYGVKFPAPAHEEIANVNGRTWRPAEFCNYYINEVEATDEARWGDERAQSNVEMENERARLAGLEVPKGFADEEDEAGDVEMGDAAEDVNEEEDEDLTWKPTLAFRGATKQD